MNNKILLIDDEVSSSHALSYGLKQLGFDVDACEKGALALKKLQSSMDLRVSYVAIISDIKLPDIDGLKLGKIFQLYNPKTKIIYLADKADDADNIDNSLINEIDAVLLEKPVTPHQISEIIIGMKNLVNKESSSSYKTNQETSKNEKISAAYAILTIKKDCNFFETYKEIYNNKNISSCEATKGDFDIFIKVRSNSIEGCREIINNQIKTIEAINKIDFFEILNPPINNKMLEIIEGSKISDMDPDKQTLRKLLQVGVCSYILVELSQSGIDDIFPSLYLDDNIIQCDFTTGKYNLFLLAQGTQFSEIDNLIKNKISELDGILKIKEFPIISIFDI